MSKTITISDSTYKILAPVIEALETVINSPILAKVDKEVYKELKARYKGENWNKIEKALNNPETLRSIQLMEDNGHEPSVFIEDGKGYWIGTCSKEAPPQRNIDYYAAEKLAKEWGIELMTASQYMELMEQKKGKLCTDTWCHLKSPQYLLNAGLAWYGRSRGISKADADARRPSGGFRSSLWVPEA